MLIYCLRPGWATLVSGVIWHPPRALRNGPFQPGVSKPQPTEKHLELLLPDIPPLLSVFTKMIMVVLALPVGHMSRGFLLSRFHSKVFLSPQWDSLNSCQGKRGRWLTNHVDPPQTSLGNVYLLFFFFFLKVDLFNDSQAEGQVVQQELYINGNLKSSIVAQSVGLNVSSGLWYIPASAKLKLLLFLRQKLSVLSRLAPNSWQSCCLASQVLGWQTGERVCVHEVQRAVKRKHVQSLGCWSNKYW